MKLSYRNKMTKALPPSEQARRDRKFAWERAHRYTVELLSKGGTFTGRVLFFNPLTERGLLTIVPERLLPSGKLLEFAWDEVIADKIGRRFLAPGTIVEFETEVLPVDYSSPHSDLSLVRLVNVHDVSAETASIDPESHREISIVGSLDYDEHSGVLFRAGTNEPISFDLTPELQRTLRVGDRVDHRIKFRLDDEGRRVWFADDLVVLPRIEPGKVKRAELSESEVQSLQEKAVEFKNWFGNSKIVDANGKPLVAFHGTMTAPIETFEPGSKFDEGHNPIVTTTNANAYLGPHFVIDGVSANPFDDARRVSGLFACGVGELWLIERRRKLGRRAAPAVYPVFLRVENPADFRAEAFLDEFIFRGVVSD